MYKYNIESNIRTIGSTLGLDEDKTFQLYLHSCDCLNEAIIKDDEDKISFYLFLLNQQEEDIIELFTNLVHNKFMLIRLAQNLQKKLEAIDNGK